MLKLGQDRQKYLLLARRFSRASSGVTAIEFAMLLPVFLFMMLGMVDFGIVYFAESQAEIGVLAAKEAMVEVATRPKTIADIKNVICAQVPQTIKCSTVGFHVDVSQLTATSPPNSDPTADGYHLVADDVNMIRVIYPWTNVLPLEPLRYIGLNIPTVALRVKIFFYAKKL